MKKIVVVIPAKKKSRGQKLINSPVYSYAKKLNIPIRCPNNIDNKQEFDFIKNLKADIAIVGAYGQILPLEYLNLSKIKFINIHASLLPKWRGAAPIQRAIMNRDEETGISFMKIVKELKLAYEICSGSEHINQSERDKIYFYVSIRSIIFKLTKHNAPDTAQMNYKVKEMINEELKLTGHVTVALNDAIVQEIPNLVVTAGKGYVASRMKDTSASSMSHMAAGTDNTAAAAGDADAAPAHLLYPFLFRSQCC